LLEKWWKLKAEMVTESVLPLKLIENFFLSLLSRRLRGHRTCCGGDLTTEGCEESSQAQAESEESSVFDETGHTGELEIVEEEWPDHDERCHGPIDTKANRRDFPDGFEWSCCGGNAAAPSCDGDGDEW
jgi:hypothetical protein